MRCFHRVLPLETVDGRKGLTNIVVTRAGWNRISVIRWSHLPLPTHHRLSSPFFFISGRTRCVPPLPSPLLAAFDPLPRPVGPSRRNDWPPCTILVVRIARELCGRNMAASRGEKRNLLFLASSFFRLCAHARKGVFETWQPQKI